MNETDRLVEPQQVDIVYETDEPVTYEVIDHVAWIMMNRPGFNNAQNGQMTYALDDAFVRAVNDDDVRAIVLCDAGRSRTCTRRGDRRRWCGWIRRRVRRRCLIT